ncbi:MAG: hypothetical protein IJI57_06540 [Flexilinea sp.]|nr:hypothetical protein [Flexilinea sp.]
MSNPEAYKKRINNFWYYYKVPTIIFLLVFAAGIYLFLTHRQSVVSDYDVAIVSPRGCSDEQLEKLRSALEQAGQDQNGDGQVVVTVHLYRFALGADGQDAKAVAGLDADLVGKMSGIFFTEDPAQFEASANGLGKAADAVPVSEIPLLTGCGIDDLYLLIRADADEKYASLRSALNN